MFQTFRNAWKIPELKNRLLFTLAILVVYRLGCAIPVPFVSGSALTQMFANGDMLSYLNMMSGGALARCTLFALGVTPYINASIIVQLLTVAIPALENLAKEADGQQKLQQINRYAGAVVALIMSIGYYFVIRNMGALKYVSGGAGIFAAIVIIATFVAGAQLITWCGEQIDDKGIGNGVSLIIFASIVSNWSSLYTSVKGLLTQAASGKPQYYFFLPLLIVLALVAVVFVVVMTNAERRITIQYAKRVVGRKQMGGQNSYLPLKLNMSGVMPIIFASALVSIPGTIGSFLQIDQQAHPVWYAFFHTFNYTSWLYVVIYLLLILAFNYFYVAIQYNPSLLTRPCLQSPRLQSSTSPALKAVSRSATLTMAYCSKRLLKPTLGRRRARGIWPPSKPACSRRNPGPSLAAEAGVLPLPEPMPRLRVTALFAPGIACNS